MNPSRSGLATGVVLVCLLIVTSLTASMVQSTLAARRECKVRLQSEQTLWLLEAGINRAQLHLADDPSYEGETWTPGERIGAFYCPQVQISVLNSDDDGTILQATASVANASDGVRSRPFVIRKSRQWKISSSNNTHQE